MYVNNGCWTADSLISATTSEKHELTQALWSALELTVEDSYTSWVADASASVGAGANAAEDQQQGQQQDQPFFSGAVELTGLEWSPVAPGSRILRARVPLAVTRQTHADISAPALACVVVVAPVLILGLVVVLAQRFKLAAARALALGRQH